NDTKEIHASVDNFRLEQNYPNPFNPSTTIRYQLQKPGIVHLIIVDALGREVARLADGYQTSGLHQALFDGKSLASGLYFYRLSADGKVSVRKMALIK
ncbi:MAG: T9SS type A sorting domain-containing protein, partial [Ignavibacteriales bacterium]|nr:T9SS type A sorting domain-containing protein [Ignavibacteriales bacterium]